MIISTTREQEVQKIRIHGPNNHELTVLDSSPSTYSQEKTAQTSTSEAVVTQSNSCYQFTTPNSSNVAKYNTFHQMIPCQPERPKATSNIAQNTTMRSTFINASKSTEMRTK